MADLDEMLRATLQRVAEPGDPHGVAEAIRSRLDAGDVGTPAAVPAPIAPPGPASQASVTVSWSGAHNGSGTLNDRFFG